MFGSNPSAASMPATWADRDSISRRVCMRVSFRCNSSAKLRYQTSYRYSPRRGSWVGPGGQPLRNRLGIGFAEGLRRHRNVAPLARSTGAYLVRQVAHRVSPRAVLLRHIAKARADDLVVD